LQGTSRLGGISFWGNFTVTGRHEPYQPAPAFRIAGFIKDWWGEWSGDAELCPFRIIHSPPPTKLPPRKSDF
jgi:hypothetical protein